MKEVAFSVGAVFWLHLQKPSAAKAAAMPGKNMPSISVLIVDENSEEIPAIRMRTGTFYRVTKTSIGEHLSGLAVRIDDDTVCFWSYNGRVMFTNASLRDNCDSYRFVEAKQVFIEE